MLACRLLNGPYDNIAGLRLQTEGREKEKTARRTPVSPNDRDEAMRADSYLSGTVSPPERVRARGFNVLGFGRSKVESGMD